MGVDQSQIKYSVVVPVYNSEATLSLLIERIIQVLNKTKENYELIFVDDESIDNSWEILKKEKNKFSQMHIIRLTKNTGQYMSTLCGIQKTRGENIITIDDDLQYPPEEMEGLINSFHKSNCKIMYGMPAKKQQDNIKKMLSGIVGYIGFVLIGNHTGKPQWLSSFRMFKRSLICDETNTIDIAFHIETYLQSKVNKNDVGFVMVNHKPRVYGKSGNTYYKKIQQLLYTATHAIEDNIKKGMITAIIYFVLLGYFLCNYKSFDTRLQLFIIIAFALIGSLIGIFTGLYLRLLSKKHSSEKGEKEFYIKEELQ